MVVLIVLSRAPWCSQYLAGHHLADLGNGNKWLLIAEFWEERLLQSFAFEFSPSQQGVCPTLARRSPSWWKLASLLNGMSSWSLSFSILALPSGGLSFPRWQSTTFSDLKGKSKTHHISNPTPLLIERMHASDYFTVFDQRWTKIGSSIGCFNWPITKFQQILSDLFIQLYVRVTVAENSPHLEPFKVICSYKNSHHPVQCALPTKAQNLIGSATERYTFAIFLIVLEKPCEVQWTCLNSVVHTHLAVEQSYLADFMAVLLLPILLLKS